MPDFDYEAWWSLQLRVAKGETLLAQEAQAYQAGLGDLDSQTEPVEGDTVLYLRTLRAAISRAADQHATLTARSAELDTKIAALEDLLN
ncbi:hypothetical protein GC175_05095 [bacterium]|nr:hypothetical protein [bacterium]